MQLAAPLVPIPAGDAAEVRAEAAGGRPKKTKKAKGKKAKGSTGVDKVDPAVRDAWDVLECDNRATKLAAQVYWEAAQRAGVQAAPTDCVLLAAKVYEDASLDYEELEGEDFIDFDIAKFAVAERAIFKAISHGR